MRSAAVLLLLLFGYVKGQSPYYGRELGKLTELHHGVRGRVYAIDSRTLFLRDFHYDGEGPTAYFYVGSTKAPGSSGSRLRDERGGVGPLRRYRGEDITLSLPDGKTLRDVKWFSVWCEEFTVNFGDVTIPRDLDYPKPVKVSALRGVHGVSSDPIVVVDAQTLLIPNFSYDGEAPDAKFWVGRGDKPSPQGIRIPDENGKENPLRKYDKKTIVLTLPGELTVFDIGHFAVWCEAFTVNFGHVSLPRHQLSNIPPSLKMLGVSPQSKLNCEVLHDELAFEVRWAVAGDSIVLQLVAKLEDGEYMSFGISGDPHHSQMVGGDVAVAWVEKSTLKGYAHDYYLDAKSQCAGVSGSCPDERLVEGTNSIRTLNAALVNGYSIVTYQRSLKAADHLDLPVLTNQSQPIIWALGPLNSRDEVSYHHHFTKGDKFLEFGRPPVWNCPMPEADDEHNPEPPHAAAHNHDHHHREPVKDSDGVSTRTTSATQQRRGSSAKTQGMKATADKDGSSEENTDGAAEKPISPEELAILEEQARREEELARRQEELARRDEEEVRRQEELGRRDEELVRRKEELARREEEQSRRQVELTRRQEEQQRVKQEEEVRKKAAAQILNTKNSRIKPNPVPTPRPVPKSQPWEIPAIQCYEPPDGVFYAQMGPTGGKQGYSAITGHVGWGISWYINGLLIPEINVVRGKKYTFVVEGGHNPDVPARYHPFYITNDPVGGYQHKNDQEKKGIEIYAGVRRTRSGELIPSGVGRLCNWTPDNEGPEADEYPSFGAYQRSLTLVCEEGNPGVVTWTPDRKTPDTVYYQCYTHRHLGWKINVVDECDDADAEESRVVETIVLPEDLVSQESVQVHSRTAPDNVIDQRKKIEKIINTKTNYDNFSSISGLTGEIFEQDDRNQLYANEQEFELPISKVQIKEVIEAVENLESKMKDDIKKDTTTMKPLSQYQVHEEVKEMFVPEQPIREDEEYVVETGKVPETYFLPPNQKPLTLQSVLRPNGPKPSGHMRPPFRRPAPPEIKMRRPPPMFQKVNGGYPLPMPNAHGSHTMQKKPLKYPNNRLPPNMNRPPMSNLPPVGNIPPMKSMPAMHHKPTFHQMQHKQPPKFNGPTIILGKPVSGNMQVPLPTKSQTLSLGQTDIIANQVVKSQITLPGSIDALAQHSSPQTYQTGQIILGKPMENPVPLDQQMIQTKPQILRTPPTPRPMFFQSTTHRIKLINDHQSQNEIKSSDFIGESSDSSTIRPAMNTGFKPDSIVVESGFKPIIREPLMAGEDRIADYEGNSNRREDTDVEEDYEESPQPISNHAYSSEKITETFEPMFIPSPEDHLLPTNDRTKEVFPKNHAKEDRPHPVYVKKESELNALFSKKNMDRDVPDMVMESDRVSPHYLPPDPKFPKEQSQKLSSEQTFTTYDGKTVSAATLTSIPDVNKTSTKMIFSSKLPVNTELLLKSPQFGPFKGEIPPPVTAHIAEDSQLKLPDINSRTTKLKLVNLHKPEKPDVDDLKTDGSKKHEITVKPDDYNEEEYYEDEEEKQEEERKKRHKRESKATQFEKGEVEQVHTNGHSMIQNQIDFDDKSTKSSANIQRLWSATLVLLFLWSRIL